MSLSRLRSRWMDTPERLMRVTRHYERAVHILIRKTVCGVKAQTLGISASRRPAIGDYIQSIQSEFIFNTYIFVN